WEYCSAVCASSERYLGQLPTRNQQEINPSCCREDKEDEQLDNVLSTRGCCNMSSRRPWSIL
ncbi:hypothetical protein LINPERPRIM_LOCUS24950, partial [Linum perenne]